MERIEPKPTTICPLIGKNCISEKCVLWKAYTNKFFYDTGEPGECLHILAMETIINHYQPEISVRYAENLTADEKKKDIELSFPFLDSEHDADNSCNDQPVNF